MTNLEQRARAVAIVTHGCECRGADLCETHGNILAALTAVHADGRREELDALKAEVAQLELRRSETVAMCEQLKQELEEYRSLAETLGAETAISARDTALARQAKR